MVINEIKIKTKIYNIYEMSRLHFKSLKGPNMHQIVKIKITSHSSKSDSIIIM